MKVAPQAVERNGRFEGHDALGLPAAARAVHDLLIDADLLPAVQREERKGVIELAQAGDAASERMLGEWIADILHDTGIRIQGMQGEVADQARILFDRLFGLDVLGSLYRQPGVDEIRCNNYRQIYYQERGQNKRAGQLRFAREEDLENLIRRLILHDGRSISRSDPVVESQRLDGTRITATVPPFTRQATLVLRRHGTFHLTPESIVASGMVDQRLLTLLAALVRGRANIVISGATSSGKSSLLRFLVRYFHPLLRIVTLENVWELNLDEAYPDRDVVAVQEVPGRLSMQEAFRHVLRQTPNVIIVGEARAAEADEMVKACLRGHDGTMGTVHFVGAREAIRGIARMIVIDGRKPAPLELQELEVAEALDVVVQMRGDPENTGRRIVEDVSEVIVDGQQIRLHSLCRWEPVSPDHWWEGSWEFPCEPSARLQAKMARYGVVLDAAALA